MAPRFDVSNDYCEPRKSAGRRGGLEDEWQPAEQSRDVFGRQRRRPGDATVRLRRGGLVGRGS